MGTSRSKTIANRSVNRESKEGGDKKVYIFILSGILIFTSIIYSQSLKNGFVNWDDYQFIIENSFIRNFSLQGIVDIFSTPYCLNYQPLTTLTWLIEYRLQEFNPFIYHCTNLVLHLINIVLVFFLINMLTGNKTISLLTAFFFAVHPMHTESVVWVSERKDVLYTLFYLASIAVYIYYTQQNYKLKYLLLSLGFFLLSLFSKSMAVTLPLVLIIIDYYYYDRKIFSMKCIIEKVPFFVLSIIFSIVNVVAQQSGGGLSDLSVLYSLYNRIFIITYGLAFYLTELIFPFNLSILHYFPEEKNGLLPVEYYLSLVFIILLIWFIVKTGKARKYVLFGFLFFIITLLPVLQLIPVGKAIVSERYTYVPYIGVFLVIFTFISELKPFQKKLKFYAYSVIVLLSVYYSYSTWNRVKVWENGVSLWSEFVSKNPDYYYGYYGLGGAYGKFQNYAAEIEGYNRCISLNPGFYKAYCDRGMAKDYSNDMQGAIADYNKTIELEPNNGEAYNNRAVDNFKMKKFDEALSDYNKSLSLNPYNPVAYMNRALVYIYFNDKTKACEDLNRAISLKYTRAQELIDKVCR